MHCYFSGIKLVYIPDRLFALNSIFFLLLRTCTLDELAVYIIPEYFFGSSEMKFMAETMCELWGVIIWPDGTLKYKRNIWLGIALRCTPIPH
jgi:hypothetical protein